MSQITRDQFMEFFRDDDFHLKMSVDDCREVFATVLVGSSDLEDAEFIVGVFDDYCADIDPVYNLLHQRIQKDLKPEPTV